MLDPVRAKLKLIAFTTAAFVGGLAFASGLEWTTGSHASTLLQVAPSRAEVEPLAELSRSFIAISEAVTPAVVSIHTQSPPRAGREHPEIPEELREMFPFPLPPGGGDGPQPGGGSGFLITPDGYVMTNNHVVEGASQIMVVLRDRREFPARVIGRDPSTDIAVIKIEGENFPSLELGSSEDTRVGEWVLAIGNPLDLAFTVTAGIISAKGRPLDGIIQQSGGGAYAIEDFIQTDAPINPGNSGGPLVNIRGDVIGVNSAIASRTGFYSGYGFAIPVDLARQVADNLIRYGRVRRAALGVQIEEVEPEDAEVFRLPRIAGVLVQGFPPSSPAQQAGVRPGDVIVAVNGQEVERGGQLQRVIAGYPPGETVSVDVIRSGDRERLRIELMEAPAPPVAASPPPAPRPRTGNPLGIEVAPLTAELAQRFRFGQPGGVVITEVQPFGPAFQKQVGPGWRVVSAQGQPIRDAAQFGRVVAGVRPGAIVSLVLAAPEGQQRIVNIRTPE